MRRWYYRNHYSVACLWKIFVSPCFGRLNTCSLWSPVVMRNMHEFWMVMLWDFIGTIPFHDKTGDSCVSLVCWWWWWFPRWRKALATSHMTSVAKIQNTFHVSIDLADIGKKKHPGKVQRNGTSKWAHNDDIYILWQGRVIRVHMVVITRWSMFMPSESDWLHEYEYQVATVNLVEVDSYRQCLRTEVCLPVDKQTTHRQLNNMSLSQSLCEERVHPIHLKRKKILCLACISLYNSTEFLQNIETVKCIVIICPNIHQTAHPPL